MHFNLLIGVARTAFFGEVTLGAPLLPDRYQAS